MDTLGLSVQKRQTMYANVLPLSENITKHYEANLLLCFPKTVLCLQMYDPASSKRRDWISKQDFDTWNVDFKEIIVAVLETFLYRFIMGVGGPK
jgi:hypothetical protein